MSDHTEAQSIAALATQNIAPQLETLDMVPYLILKDGATSSLESLQNYPRRKRGAATLIEPESFVAYVTAHKEPGTILTGDVTETSGTFGAIFDGNGDGEKGTPKWGENRATLSLQLTPEWARWLENNNKSKPQMEFAEFLEDNVADIVRPSGAELKEVALSLQAAKSVNFRQATRLDNGQHQIRFEEIIEAKAGQSGQLEIPERFVIEIAPFVGCPRVEIEARLRYRITEGRLSFFYRLNRPHLVILDAWSKARADIEKRTGLLVHRGTAQVINPFARKY